MLSTDLEVVLDTLPYSVFIKDSQHRFIYVNEALKALIGCDDVLGKDDRSFYSKDQVDVFWREDAKVLAGEESLNEEQIGENRFAITKKVPFTFSDGSRGLLGTILDYIDIKPDLRPVSLPGALVGGLRPDMTALKRRLEEALGEKEKALEVARTDAATGLRNRYGFEADLQHQIEEADRTGQAFGLAVIDLDHFKRINDRFGHSAGDEVLRTVGKRLSALPGALSIGRIGGDEFAVITNQVGALEEANFEKLERFRKFVFRPTFSGEYGLKISGSAGVCLYPRDGKTASELLSRADMALLAAKRSGRGSARPFDEVTRNAYQRRMRIEEKLPDAIREGCIRPVFQPIVSSRSRRAVGVEVLARWRDEELGHVGPDEFVAAATDIGVIGKLDRSIFFQASAIAKDWVERGNIDFISLNLSPMDVVTPGFATDMLRRIECAGLSPASICLEILESSLVEDVNSASRNLNRLREAGVQIALDDYGTGFSNLRALLDMPLDKLKIDKSLVSGIEDNDKVLDLVISLVQLGRALNLTMVAEGVETESQGAFIEGAGCPEMQGYYFSRPLDASQMDAWLAAQPVLQQDDDDLRVMGGSF